MRLAGFGGLGATDCRLAAPRDEAAVRARLAEGPLIARGAGLAYGDSALNPNLTLSTLGMNRMLDFDPSTGVLAAEAGVTLADIVQVFLPRGWFPAVVPGTRHVTLGGAIAADVHGKNHRCDGSFGGHVRWLDLMEADGTVRRLAPEEELFDATVGGMGLTGVILRAAIALRAAETGWLRQRTEAVPDVAAAMAALEGAEAWHYAIAWIDCLAGAAAGRALVHLGQHAALADLDARQTADPYAMRGRASPAVPLTPPVSLVRAGGVRLMNAMRYRRAAAGPVEELADWRRFFFPLDGLGHWNRLYGRGGFVQHQSVVGLGAAGHAIPALVDAARGRAMLATLKRFGPGRGGLSFPTEGFSLALDLPGMPRDLLGRLDRIVLDHGGRFYLAKDARLDPATLSAADPRLPAFRALRAQSGAAQAFRSAQSERLGI